MILSVTSRFFNLRKIDVGLGPEPLVNNVYHKKALKIAGLQAETFVNQLYFITNNFDYIPLNGMKLWDFLLIDYWLFVRSIFRYKCIYIYFNGGSLFRQPMVKWLEPYLYNLSGVKIVVMPYGGDIQELNRTSNLIFKNNVITDYPAHGLRRKRIENQIDRWTRHADHVISGCDWIEYMNHWDTLTLGHFSIDTEKWVPAEDYEVCKDGILRVLHAPNHRGIKGTKHVIRAVKNLQERGYKIELKMLEGVSNEKVLEVMQYVDVVVDQLIIGWYAMFAMEAMALSKPTLCFIRQDFEEMYIEAELLNENELPLINCNFSTIEKELEKLCLNIGQLKDIGINSRIYVHKKHSLQTVSEIFKAVHDKI